MLSINAAGRFGSEASFFRAAAGVILERANPRVAIVVVSRVPEILLLAIVFGTARWSPARGPSNDYWRRVDRDAAFLHLVAKVHPTRQFLGAVNDGFIPRGRFLFDALSVSQPANVGPIRGNRIERQLGRTGPTFAGWETERASKRKR